jgi:hypothetical protein
MQANKPLNRTVSIRTILIQAMMRRATTIKFFGAVAQSTLEFRMLKNIWLGLLIAVTLCATLALVGCGGVGSAPLNAGTLAGVAVSVSPQTMTVTTGTTQPFTAAVINSGETGVAWLVNGFPGGVNPSNGASLFGTIDKNGNYTAPPFVPIPPTVTVTAVANADNSASANASVSINGTPSPVSISPISANIEVGGNVLFTGKVDAPNPAANWLVDNVLHGNTNVGTISPVPGNAEQVLYTAPLVVPGGGQTAQIQVTVQSVANPQEAATAVVNLSAATVGGAVVTIISPPVAPTVQAGQTQAFQASVTGVSDTTVSWQVDAIPGGNPNVGTITAGSNDTAVYTAPVVIPATPTVTVTAVSNAQPSADGSMPVHLIPFQKTTVSISADECTNPNAIPVNIGATAMFTAQVTGSNQNVTWQVNQITGGNSSVGTITQGGLYTAPANVPNPPTVVVAAVSVANPDVIGKESITITSSPQPIVTVACTPDETCGSNSTSVPVNQMVNFTATVAGLGNSDVGITWNVDNEAGGDPTIGTINQEAPTGCVTDGGYLAPLGIPNPNPVSVTAVAIDGTSSAGFNVTVLPPPPITELLSPGASDPSTVQVQTPGDDQVQYTDSQTKLVNGQEVPDTTDPVNWTLTSTTLDCSVNNGSICGTLTPGRINESQQFTATYNAPLNVPSNPVVTVTVTSAIDSSASDYNQITITSAPPTIAVTGPQQVQAGTGPYIYTAVINNASPDQLVWNLGCISDTDSQNQEDFCGPRTSYGPGCIKDSRGGEVCDEQGVTLPPFTVVYTPPGEVSNAYYLQNACTLNGDPKASIVPINVEMIAQGCPLQDGVPTCTAIACVTVTAP